ncbi:MAG TPA: prolyl oligopeptidase family serine peptidase [Acidobacteriaceae bacterium]|nr:prolyl oligopeptidase family serine peptidase [Acidobacteriaceae bacterium]
MRLRSLPGFTAALLASLSALAPSLARSQSSITYQKPPQAIVDLLEAPPTPLVVVSPPATGTARTLLLLQPGGLLTIADLAQPELRLAGLRFNPRTNGPSRLPYVIGLKFKSLPAGKELAVTGLPAHPHIEYAQWSPDARRIAFVVITGENPAAGLSLWTADAATAHATRIPGVALNGVFGNPCSWMPDSRSLLCRTVSSARGPAPVRSEVPTGPAVQQNLGRVTPARTYEDLLKNPEDERFFDYYATAQVRLIALAGTSKPIGKPAVIAAAEPSPDGHYALVIESHHPYSYELPFENFPQRTVVIDLRTGTEKQLSDVPLADNIPIAFDAVQTGPRDYEWRPDVPATLAWVEAADSGNPKIKADVRDRLFVLDAPFTASPRALIETPMRFAGVQWGNAHLALVNEREWNHRRRVICAIDPSSDKPTLTKLYEGSSEDRYHDPGRPVQVENAAGRPVLDLTADGAGIYFDSTGASSEGDRPFLAVMNATTGKEDQVWRSAAPFYELPAAVIDPAKPEILIRRESADQPPNYFLHDEAGKLTQVTDFPNPYGNTPLPKKQILKYKRADGVELSANLYLPPGYKSSDGPLPTLMEAYPVEYRSRSAAGQVTGSPYQFPRFTWGGPVFFVTQGYAVLENAAIPIIGEGNALPNDTYTEQLVSSAKAAIDEGASLGAVDRNRVAVMGHSYGAFMTANLLAHSDLFKAGIARSGAYNRTLTPFGFQNEERTYWEAPDVYNKMSPFAYADKIKAPILLIHGEADNNQGTFPIQSERFYDALKGHGATVRLVFLPLEAHGYAARESLLHMLWEMNNWLDTYVKNPPPAVAAGN